MEWWQMLVYFVVGFIAGRIALRQPRMDLSRQECTERRLNDLAKRVEAIETQQARARDVVQQLGDHLRRASPTPHEIA